MPMNPVELSCDVVQGFNFRKDMQVQIGFITEMKIGDVSLTADISCKDPENNQSDKKVVGIASFVGWTVSPTDPVNINIQVSETAKNKLDTLTKKNMSNVEVEYKFDCYSYDPSEKKYYKNFHTNNTAMKGLIYGQGDDLAIRINLDQSRVVQEPRNYTLSMGLKPQPKAQELHYASSVADKLVMQWGVTKA
jgi:hypothetical protein